MTQHTRGKLNVSNRVDVRAEPQGAMAYISVAGARGRTLEEAEANARRIAACWNFCDGTDTEYIEGAPTLGRCILDRADLAAVCKLLAKLKTGPTNAGRVAWINNVLAIAEQAREALAKADAP